MSDCRNAHAAHVFTCMRKYEKSRTIHINMQPLSKVLLHGDQGLVTAQITSLCYQLPVSQTVTKGCSKKRWASTIGNNRESEQALLSQYTRHRALYCPDKPYKQQLVTMTSILSRQPNQQGLALCWTHLFWQEVSRFPHWKECDYRGKKRMGKTAFTKLNTEKTWTYLRKFKLYLHGTFCLKLPFYSFLNTFSF